jgi:hypothetical protein
MSNNLTKSRNKLKGKQGYRETMFFKTSDVEYSLIVGVIVTTFLSLCTILPDQIQPALILGGVMTLLQYLGYVVMRLYYRLRQEDYQTHEIILYEGNLDKMMLAFYRVGLKLKSQIGKYYIFTTSYRTISNSEFVVREVEGGCVVQANPALIRELKNYIDLVSLKNKSVDEYKNAANNAA